MRNISMIIKMRIHNIPDKRAMIITSDNRNEKKSQENGFIPSLRIITKFIKVKPITI
jgi:hypothetical protein